MPTQALSRESLEKQRKLWLDLATALEQAQRALLAGDLATLEKYSGEQKTCCDRLSREFSDIRLAPVNTSASNQRGAAAATGGHDAVERLEEIRTIQLRVRHFARVQAALLRGASRTVRVQKNILRQADNAYNAMADSNVL